MIKRSAVTSLFQWPAEQVYFGKLHAASSSNHFEHKKLRGPGMNTMEQPGLCE